MCLHFLYNSKDIKSMMGNKSRETNSYCCLRPVGDDLGVQRIPLCQDHLFAAKFATICRARNKTFAIYISPDVHNCWTVSIINTRALNHSKALVASRNPSPVPMALQKDDGCQLTRTNETWTSRIKGNYSGWWTNSVSLQLWYI